MLVWENHRINFEYLNNNSIIVDAGSCRGSFIEFVREHLDCKIYAIEPCKTHVEFLNSKNYLNVEIINKVLIGKSNINYVNFNEYVGLPKWGSIYDRNVTHKKLKEVISYTVNCININDIFKVLGIDHIDYLKLDIEGAEFDVFYSMNKQIASKIYQFSAEIHTINYDISEISNLIYSVNESGYKCSWFREDHELWGIQNNRGI